MDLTLMERELKGLVPKVEAVLHRAESLWPAFVELQTRPAHQRSRKVDELLGERVMPLVPELERLGRAVDRLDRRLRQHEQRQAAGRLADRNLPRSERHRARGREASGRRLERLRDRIDGLHRRVERFDRVVRSHVRTAHGGGVRDLADAGSVFEPIDDLRAVEQILGRLQQDAPHLEAPDAVGSLADAVSTLVFLVSGIIALARRRQGDGRDGEAPERERDR